MGLQWSTSKNLVLKCKERTLSAVATNMTPSHEDVLKDYRLVLLSRFTSLLGRKEVLNGKAKFGIFGDGKELAQIAMAKAFHKGDWRSGYYRDQTFMFALGISSIREFFAQLYADTSIENEPASGGRQMNCHFATRYISESGEWKNQTETFNSSSDVSPTGGQMARLMGLAYASKLYRNEKVLKSWKSNAHFTRNGNEIAFGTIGNAAAAEGVFWETMNAATVLQIPLAMSIWDDGYGISVPNELQIAKGSLSTVFQGFAADENSKGLDIYKVRGDDYLELIRTYKLAIEKCRTSHAPCLIHVTHMTQPQGHSTSGSHERYKSKERLAYEDSIDCIKKMRAWILEENIAQASLLDQIEAEAQSHVEQERQAAWEAFQKPIESERKQLLAIGERVSKEFGTPTFETMQTQMQSTGGLMRRQIDAAARAAEFELLGKEGDSKLELKSFLASYRKKNEERYSSFLYTQHHSPLNAELIPPVFSSQSQRVDGRQIIQKYFESKLEKDPRVFILGEDVGQLGGVNLEFEGLNKKFGEHRVTDTGIREMTIFGQGLGAAMRGLRPLVDIQYLDYLIFALQGMSDDLASLHFRSAGGQLAPVIVRTKGHRLEGIWHTGSPMGMILGSLRGMHICVPRNCTQAAGLYQTLFNGDDPALLIEVLNGYRVKELLPDNIGEYTVPLGVCEILQEGKDITVVSYGACLALAQTASKELAKLGISLEIIDIQTLLPFDLKQTILASIMKTNAVLFLDEDVPGGATAYMMQEVLEKQKAYDYLDAAPRTLSAKAHRSSYGSDGDYFSKPSVPDIIETVYKMMHERDPERFGRL